MSPMFSIVIPTYNRAWCIERAIDSVLRQKFQDWELIVIDDGSSDETSSIVKKYLSDQRVKYFYKENGGVGSARNLGIRNSIGQHVLFLDSDDELTNEALDIIYSAVTKYKEAKILSFRVRNQNGMQVSYTEKVKGDRIIDFRDFVSQKYIKGETFFVYKIELLYENSFNEDVNGGEALLFFRLIKNSGLVVVNADARIYHTESYDSLISSKLTSKKIENICKIQTLLIEEYEEDLKENNKKYLGTAYLVLARALALSGKKVLSLKFFIFGCFYNKFDIKRMGLYLISMFDHKLKINNALNSFFSNYNN